MTLTFVPERFGVPMGLVTASFVLEPLGPQHNDRDHAAWMSSIEYIHSLPGFDDPTASDPWPVEMTLHDNMADLEMHARDFAERSGFTYTVLDPVDGDVIGCVYIYPARDEVHEAAVRSWVRATHSDLDVPVWQAVSAWLARDWPFDAVAYAARNA